MCKWKKHGDTRIDPCMRELVKWLGNKHKTILSCCGHGKYPMSVIVKEYETRGSKRFIVFKEIFSGIVLRVKENPLKQDPKKFYKRDKQGYYYIPEVENSQLHSCTKEKKKCPCGNEFSYWRNKSDLCRDCRLKERRENK